MRKLLLPAAMATAIATAAIALAASPAPNTAADPALDSEEVAFATLINNYRAQNGLGPLLIDPDLAESADWMSNDMGVRGYFSHTDSLGRSPWDRMCAFGYCHNTWKGENIAAGYATGQSAFNAWRGSPSHNSNMLGANFRVMGIGRMYVAGSQYGWYWTNDFGGLVTAAAFPPAAPTATPAPTPAPSQPGCSGDTDCDGWLDLWENYLGTNRLDACSNTTTRNDENSDAWPPDINDDRSINTVDAGAYIGLLGVRSGEAGFRVRLDLVGNGVINTSDVGVIVINQHRTC